MGLDAGTATLLRETLRQAFSSSSSASVDRLLEELGWDEVMDEDAGGAVRLLFEEHGAALAGSAVLDRVMLRAGDEALRGCTRVLHPLPPALFSQPATGSQAVVGLLLAGCRPEDRVVLLDRVDDESALLVFEAEALSEGAPGCGLDPELGWTVHEAPRSAAFVIAVGRSARLLWEPVRAAGHRALASELLGVSRAALEVAVEHVGVRSQFGRPIGSFQAVRHRLAEAYAHTAGADAMIEAAWMGGDASSAEAAKAFAGQAHSNVTRHAMQVCGAIGLTWEHPLHRYVRRGFLLDILLGSHPVLAERLGRRLLDGQDAPRVCRF